MEDCYNVLAAAGYQIESKSVRLTKIESLFGIVWKCLHTEKNVARCVVYFPRCKVGNIAAKPDVCVIFGQMANKMRD